MLKPTTQTLLSLLFLFVIGCHHDPYLDDDEGSQTQDQSGQTDTLSLPYVQGTKVRISVYGNGADGVAAWKLKSDNPAVLAVDKLAIGGDATPTLTADCTAVGAGDTVLRLSDAGGAELRVSKVSVAIPDRVRVLSHGQLRLVDQNSDALLKTEVHEARILTGSQGVFALVYQKGEQRLYGRGVMQADPVSMLTVTSQTTMSSPVTEWVVIKPQATGSFSLTLHGGPAMVTLPVVSVPETDIGSVGLSAQQVSSPKTDQNLWMLFQARDMMGRDIQGVFASWTLGGAMQTKSGGDTTKTTGDLYRFAFADGAAPQELAATHNTLRAATTVTASKGAIYDTTYLGCSLGQGTRGSSPLGPLTALAALGLILRLRRRRQPPLVVL